MTNPIKRIEEEFDKKFLIPPNSFLTEEFSKEQEGNLWSNYIRKEGVAEIKSFLRQQFTLLLGEVREAKIENKIECASFSEDPDFRCKNVLFLKDMQATVKTPNLYYCKECYQRGLNMEYEAMGLYDER